MCIFYQHDVMTLWQLSCDSEGHLTLAQPWVAGLWTLRRPMHEQDWGCPVEPFFTFSPLTIVSLNFTFCFAYLSFEFMAHLLFGDLN